MVDSPLPPGQDPFVPIILLIGLPGSGKSTLAQKLVEVWPATRLISTDAIRAQLFGDEATQGPWLQVWREVRCQLHQSAQLIRQGNLDRVLFDATNAVRKQRRQVVALARSQGFTHVCGLWLNTALPLCLERNQHRDRQVPIPVILRMHRCLVGAVPSLEEGLDGVIEVGMGSTGGNAVREE